MDVNPTVRAHAASALLDSVSVIDADDDGSEEADRRLILALRNVLSLEVESEAVQATVAAATDLIWGLTKLLSQYRAEDREVTVSRLRDALLPFVYPEVFGDSRD